jgi:hypothetical protein
MKPSEKAIKAAHTVLVSKSLVWADLSSAMLEAAYAIDVAPLEIEIERLRLSLDRLVKAVIDHDNPDDAGLSQSHDAVIQAVRILGGAREPVCQEGKK